MKGLYLFASAAALCALASPAICFADNGDGSSGGGSPSSPPSPAAPAASATANGQADAAAEKAAAEKAAAEKAAAEKAPRSKPAHVIWAMPGHAVFGIGVMVRTPDEATADALRAAGQARLATPAEVAEHKKHDRPIHDLG